MEELPSEDFFSLTSLEEFNFNREKEFKLSVLDWLNNGKPKLFKSPAEGNYIVRLMNASLAPQESLGRMLHTFSCTAYEIADYNLKNLKEHKFLPEEILFEQEENIYNFTNTSKSVSLSGTISHMALYGIPGTLFTCSYTSGGVNKTENKTIPNSGIYIFSKEELNKRYKQISFASSVSITTDEFYLTYISKASTSLTTIKATSISTENISTTSGDSKTLGKNFRGYGVYFLEDEPSIINSEKNIIKSTESTDSTTKTKIDYEGFYGRVFRKPEVEVIKDSSGKYRNESGNEITSWSVNNLYKLVSEDGKTVEKYYAIASTSSSSNSPTFRNSVDWFAIHNGEEYLDHLQSGYYIVKDFNQLYLGKGLMCTVYGLEKTTISTLPGEGEANKIYAL
jgi:hypothetical protein